MADHRRASWSWALAAVLAAGAALRFSTLSVQSFWLDEAVTHQLVTKSLGAMLRAIPHSESTPPLYYLLVWAWVRVFGAHEAGLRSLSALFGTATIVLIALIARRLAGGRAAVAAAALAAANPLLIWYSQEARAYALLVALCALSLWCLLREDWRGWAIAAVLALATHYFAAFLVVPELGWLVWRHARNSQAAAYSAAAVAVAGAALLPLAIVQAAGDRAAYIRSSALGTRAVAVPKQLLIGYATPHATVLALLAGALALLLALQLRSRDRALLGLAALGVGVPLALALLGPDYLITRNVMAAIVPLLALGGVGAARTRAGPVLVGGLCAVGLAAYIGVENNAVYQRDDWRAVAAAIGPHPPGSRVVLVNPPSGALPLEYYLPLVPAPPAVSPHEVDVVELRDQHPPAQAILFPDFSATITRTPEFTLVRYRSGIPVGVGQRQLRLRNLEPAAPAILIDG
jgi:mannosyltransferase